MSDYYYVPKGKRKSKKDKKAKRKKGYKKGGKFRSSSVEEGKGK